VDLAVVVYRLVSTKLIEGCNFPAHEHDRTGTVQPAISNQQKTGHRRNGDRLKYQRV
jgi:hypothetical protein